MAGEDILVVDDSVTNLKLARIMLQREGYGVRTATGADDALRAISILKPRLILMDVRLSGIDGLELTRRLKADLATKDVVILALSASGNPSDRRNALAAGCDGYVEKPFELDSLLRVIAGHLLARQTTP
jgi:two-component system cell cycle response regulator DivK